MSELGAILETGGAAAVELAASALSGHGGSVGHCANCAKPLFGPFCAACGQPSDVHRRSLRHLLGDFIADLASFDSRILRTARALMLQPGELARAFHEGRTQPFVPPVRLYLFVSLMFFLLLSATGIALIQFELETSPMKVELDDQGHPFSIQNGMKQVLPQRYADNKPHYSFNSQIEFFRRVGAVHSRLPPEARQRLEAKLNQNDADDGKSSWMAQGVKGGLRKLMDNPASLNEPVINWVPRALFTLLPLFALLLAAFYWRLRREFFFVDHLVFSLSFHTFGFALLMIAAVVAQFVPPTLVGWVVLVALPLYLLLAIRRMYGQSWVWTGVKFSALSIIYTVFFLLPAFGIILALAIFGVDGPHIG